METCSDWWMSTMSPTSMFRPEYQTGELADYLRENTGVDPAILAADVGIGPGQVMAYQRKLGLRKISGTRPRRPRVRTNPED
jgi:hypothetical protein